MQVVSSSVNTGPNEIQTISTSCADVDEVQTVQTTANLVQEVQQVVVSNAGTGYFTLVLDTSASGGSLQLSSQLAYNALAAGSATAVKESLMAMQNVGLGMVFDVTSTTVPLPGSLATTTYVSSTLS